MKKKNINFELQGKVRKYLEYMMHSESDVAKEEEILGFLTSALRKELVLESNGKYIYQTPIFTKNFSDKVLEKAAFCLKEVKYSPEEFIYHVFFLLIIKKYSF